MLKKPNRLSTTYEFNKVRRFGGRAGNYLFEVFYLAMPAGQKRVGVVVSNRFSKSAPERNRVKRVFREVVRLNLDKIKDGYWIVIHPKFASKDKGYEEINAEFNKILSKVPFAN